MKKLGIVFVSLMFISPLIFADVLPPSFQAKRNIIQRQGITYTVILPSEYEDEEPIEYVVTERGKDKLFESDKYGTNKYLLKDNKVYQIPDLTKVPEDALVSISVLTGDARAALMKKRKSLEFRIMRNLLQKKKKPLTGSNVRLHRKLLKKKENWMNMKEDLPFKEY